MSPTPDRSPESTARSGRRIREALGDVGMAFFNFPTLADVQRASIPAIAEGLNVLVCAATATGKTEAIIAPLIWRLRQALPRQPSGPRLLAVAPTRALVADLSARLEGPLAQLGWRCAAQTSDFAGADSPCDVLVTTPESFDSMLVRRVSRKQGVITDHLLANVAAVFVDEAHCFDSSVRGDQLIFLLARLRKLCSSARAKGWAGENEVQVCAASATVYEPEFLANRLLGSGAKVIVCPGSRPLAVWTVKNHWLNVEQSISADAVAQLLPLTSEMHDVCQLIWRTLESGEFRKALIFVPSRRDCDLLGRELNRFVGGHREMSVESHHGSLSREHRQRAEESFHRRRDAVLVATNTLEVGVDIGDVDIVGLVGAPPDTSSLLQRIGRGGRRFGQTKLLPIARNAIDAAALGSQIVCAVQGQLEIKCRLQRWDIWPQQVISYIRQNHGRGRSQSALIDLIARAWPDSRNATIAEAHIRAWRNDGRLSENRGTLHLAGDWARFAAHAESDYTVHSNIRSAPAGVAVRKELTGEVIGHVRGQGENKETLTIAGRRHRVAHHDGAILVTPVTDQGADEREDTPNYGGRRRRVSETFAAHIRAGCGLGIEQAPLIIAPNVLVWFHFGGEVFESAARELFPNLLGSPIITGIALRVVQDFDSNALRSFDASAATNIIQSEGLRILKDEGLGRFADDLPPVGVKALMSDLKIEDRFKRWLTTRQVVAKQPLHESPALEKLLANSQTAPKLPLLY